MRNKTTRAHRARPNQQIQCCCIHFNAKTWLESRHSASWNRYHTKSSWVADSAAIITVDRRGSGGLSFATLQQSPDSNPTCRQRPMECCVTSDGPARRRPWRRRCGAGPRRCTWRRPAWWPRTSWRRRWRGPPPPPAPPAFSTCWPRSRASPPGAHSPPRSLASSLLARPPAHPGCAWSGLLTGPVWTLLE